MALSKDISTAPKVLSGNIPGTLVFHYESPDGAIEINVLQTEEGAVITVKDPNGTTSATVKNGEQGPAGEAGPAGAQGPQGENGITPHIGENGNWYIGDTDTGIAADGSTKPTIASIAVTESADGSVTMVNTLVGGGTETLVISADANGNPNKLTYNGTEIPITWTEATATEETEVTA